MQKEHFSGVQRRKRRRGGGDPTEFGLWWDCGKGNRYFAAEKGYIHRLRVLFIGEELKTLIGCFQLPAISSEQVQNRAEWDDFLAEPAALI